MGAIRETEMLYEVEHNGVKHFFPVRAMAMTYADDNNCFLVEGKTVRQVADEAQGKEVTLEYYREFKNQLSKA